MSSTVGFNYLKFFITQEVVVDVGDYVINEDNNFHIFWNCQVIMSYWHKHNVFGVDIHFRCDTVYMGDI